MSGEAINFTYKKIKTLDIQLDLYPPSQTTSSPSLSLSPIVMYFHGGGLTVGSSKSWFPTWLKDRVVKAGFTFISAEYRLIPPSSAHEIIEDLQDLFKFLSLELNEQLRSRQSTVQIDPRNVAVTGSSAGGLCAYLAAVHAQPKPKAVVGLYAMGGNLTIPHYFEPKTSVFYRGREVLDPQVYAEFLHPKCHELTPTAQSELAYHPADAPIPGFPANPRMLLSRLYLQLGTYLDYYTGEHAHSLSTTLRAAFLQTRDTECSDDSLLEELIPQKHRILFPQRSVDSSWPPTFLVHGSNDSAVLVEESLNMHRLLQRSGGSSILRIIEGAEHSLDYVPDAERLYGAPGGLFDEILEFLVHSLRSHSH